MGTQILIFFNMNFTEANFNFVVYLAYVDKLYSEMNYL